MAITVKHSKVSLIPDGDDTSVVRPSDWNADHTLVGLGTMAEQNANSVAITGGTISGVTIPASNITGTLGVPNGGTGASTLTGYVKGTGTTPMTASATIPNTDITGLGTASTKDAGSPNGVATLDAGGKVPVSELPAAVLGALSYQGTWDASTNTPTLTSSVGTKGYYYVVSVAGNTNLNGITDWLVGDWAVYNGTVWQKVDNTETVTSVNGQTGAVVLTTTNITEGTNEYFTQARARTSISAGTGISYDNTTGVITNAAPDQTVSITGAGTTTVTGTYPNFTITSDDQFDGTVTSVGLTSSAASLAITNSPITSSGNIGVNFAGLSNQYVRGDGALANFPTTQGGGSSVSYYLNGSVNQGTFGGNTYYEMSKTPIFGTGTNFSVSADGYIAQFITDAGDPALLSIPAGNWNFELFFSASSGGGSPSFYIELYKYDGTTFTLIASDSGSPEGITNGTNKDLYFSAIAVPQTALTLTDRLAIRVYVTTSGRTITLHTEDNNLCQIITTFSTGINALNGLTAQVQYFAVGTSGTDFNIASATDTHTFNLPSASATNRGALLSADWTTFNNKVTSVSGTSGRITSSGGTTPAIDLASGIATAGTTGSSTLIPVITVDTYGRVTSVTTAENPQGTVTSVSGTGTVNGISLSGTVTSSGSLTLGGTLSNVSLSTQVTGTLPIANGGTGETTRQAAMDALAGAVTSGQYLRGNGTDVVMSAIQAADVPTLNQNTTGTAANVTGTVAVANGGTGLTSLTANRVPYGAGTSALGNEAEFTYDPSLNTLTAPQINASNGIVVNSNTVSANYTIPSGSSASSVGPMTVSSGVVVTVSSGSRWVVL